MNINRRDFLKRSVGVVAAIVAAPVLALVPEEKTEALVKASYTVDCTHMVPGSYLDKWGSLCGAHRRDDESEDQFRMRILERITRNVPRT